MRATIKMIAEKSGVSIGTVDRVLHDRPYVKAEVRQRVLEVMEQLDYRPNRMASALATSATPRHLAVIQPVWEGYIRERLSAGVNQFREKRQDYNVSVEVLEYPREDVDACLRLVDTVVKQGVQGIALCATDCPRTQQKLTELSESGIPVVTFNSDIPTGARLCYVGEDAHHAGRVAGEIAGKFLRPGDHLLLVYSGPAYAGHKARANGFLERLAELVFSSDCCQVAATQEDYEKTYQAVCRTLREDSALSCIYMANHSVPACVEAIRDCGARGRVRVVTHDSEPDICRFLREGWVDFSIGQDLAYQSRQALSVLFHYLAEHQLPEKDVFCLPSPILNAELV